MKLSSIVLASALMLIGCSAFADVSVPYGEGSGKVDYINTTRYPGLEDPVPFGPLSFRMIEDKVWIVDSVGGKLMQFNKSDGKLVSEFSVLPEGVTKAYTEETYTNPNDSKEYKSPNLNVLIEDFAPVRGDYGDVTAWWIADSQNNKLFKYSADGKKIAEIENEEFVQVSRIEIGMGGHIFVADKGASIIFVFDAEGNFVNKLDWEWTGMAVSGPEEKLYRLVFDNEAAKHNLIATGLDGEVISADVLNTEPMFNAVLWWVDEENRECLISYCPSTGFKGVYEVVRIGFDGAVKAHGQFDAPYAMNRIIDNLDLSEVYIGKCNFDKAPEGALEIIPFNLPETK